MIQTHTLPNQEHLIKSLKRSRGEVVKQFSKCPQSIHTTTQFKHQYFWNQRGKIIRHFRQVLLWHQKVNSLSLAAFNSQQHFVLGLCQVILGCEIVRNDGWLSAFCYLLPCSLEICGCWLQSKFLFSFFAQHTKWTTVIMRKPTLQLF